MIKKLKNLINGRNKQLTKPVIIQWVAIAEKMPDSDKCILISSNLGGVAEGAWNENKQYFEQWRWSAIINDVTHWAELPEPPCV